MIEIFPAKTGQWQITKNQLTRPTTMVTTKQRNSPLSQPNSANTGRKEMKLSSSQNEGPRQTALRLAPDWPSALNEQWPKAASSVVVVIRSIQKSLSKQRAYATRYNTAMHSNSMANSNDLTTPEKLSSSTAPSNHHYPTKTNFCAAI